MATYEEIRAQRIAESKAEGDRYRAMAEAEHPGTWTIPTELHDDVSEVIEAVVRGLGVEYTYLDTDDLRQEAFVMVATKAHLLETAVTPALLYKRLRRDLVNQLDTKKRKATANNLDSESTAGVFRLFNDLNESGFRGGELEAVAA